MVGGGSAGATVAARLSEIPEWNVLLLEAGRDPPEKSENPYRWTEQLRTTYDWAFFSEKSPNLWKGMENEGCLISRGRMLGGSSSINAMVYLYGTKQDFDNWRDNGCDGWGYDDVLPYFKKSQDFVDTTRFNPDIHSVGGPLTVSPLTTFDPAYDIISDAESSLDLNVVEDLNIKEPVIGYGGYDSTTRGGCRCSTLKAFLLPASNRSNLFVAKNITVSRIIVKDDTAVGVEFKTISDELKVVMCTKEVILSAGPIKSPQILLLSGIGPSEQLANVDVPVIKDLPVGLNLHDHVSFPGLVFTVGKCRPKDEIIKESDTYLKSETSLFSENIPTTGLTRLMSFIKSKPELEYPDIQLINIKLPYNTTMSTQNNKNIMANLFGYNDEVSKLYEDLNLLSQIIIMIPVLLQPLSRGQIMLRSNDPFENPMIFADYLDREEEVEALLYGIEFIIKLSKTKELVDAGFVLEKFELPQCQHCEWGTREYWLCHIKYLASPFYHVVGACKMGSIDDFSSVVDPLLKVKGINGLRVIDSSLMPQIVSVNTNAASIMIGEKGSDIIKECYGKLN